MLDGSYCGRWGFSPWRLVTSPWTLASDCRPPPRDAAGGSFRKNPALIVGKGEGGRKLDKGMNDDDPGGHDQQQEQGVNDDAGAGRALEASLEPFEGPGKLL